MDWVCNTFKNKFVLKQILFLQRALKHLFQEYRLLPCFIENDFIELLQANQEIWSWMGTIDGECR